jgi:NTP pyrophosphatase (non-canonical NTP hydrolase)
MPDGELASLVDALRRFTEERAWTRFHDPKNLAMLLSSEVGELVALLRWVPGSEADAFVQDGRNRARVEAEIADVAISLLLLCDRTGIDLVSAVRAKLEVNRRNYPVELSRGASARPERARE